MGLKFEYRGRPLAVTPAKGRAKGEQLWVVAVDGAPYLLGSGDPDRRVADFARERLTGAGKPAAPALVASRKYPLVFTIDRLAVRAWPSFVKRDRPGWLATYINPATGARVQAMKDEVYWIFESAQRPPEACGTASAEQSIDDVRDLAQLWLRTPTSPSPARNR